MVITKNINDTQVCQIILVLIIPIAHYTGNLHVWIVLIIMPIISCIQQFSYPAQTVALPKLLKKDELIKGNSLFSFANQGIDMTFNGIAGILINMVGAITIYLLDSIVFTVAFLLFWSMPVLKANGKEKKEKQKLTEVFKKYGEDLREGFQYVFQSIISKFFIATIIANFSFGIALAVMPIYADFRGGSAIYGFLMEHFLPVF